MVVTSGLDTISGVRRGVSRHVQTLREPIVHITTGGHEQVFVSKSVHHCF